MNPAIDDLLAQEMLSFTLVAGQFDVESLAAAIAGIGFSFRDATDPSRFVITSDAQSRDYFQAARRADPESLFPRVVVLQVTPDEVLVWPSTTMDSLRAPLGNNAAPRSRRWATAATPSPPLLTLTTEHSAFVRAGAPGTGQPQC